MSPEELERAKRQLEPLAEAYRPHYLYAICCPDTGGHLFIKIGRARDVASRVRDLKCGCPLHPRDIYFLRVANLREAVDLEGRLHRHFDKYRETGEWFRFDEREMRKIHPAPHAVLAMLPEIVGGEKWRWMSPRSIMKPSIRARRENLERLKKEAA